MQNYAIWISLIVPSVVYYILMKQDWKRSIIFAALFNILIVLTINYLGGPINKVISMYIPSLYTWFQNDIFAIVLLILASTLIFKIALLIMREEQKLKSIGVSAGLYVIAVYLIAIKLSTDVLERGASASEVMSGIGTKWDLLVTWFKELGPITYVMVIALIIFIIFAIAKSSEK